MLLPGFKNSDKHTCGCRFNREFTIIHMFLGTQLEYGILGILVSFATKLVGNTTGMPTSAMDSVCFCASNLPPPSLSSSASSSASTGYSSSLISIPSLISHPLISLNYIHLFRFSSNMSPLSIIINILILIAIITRSSKCAVEHCMPSFPSGSCPKVTIFGCGVFLRQGTPLKNPPKWPKRSWAQQTSPF